MDLAGILCACDVICRRDGFTSLFPIYTAFVSSPCPAAPVRTSTTTLNRSDKGRYTILVSFQTLRGALLSLSSLRVMLARGGSHSRHTCIRLRNSPSIPSLLGAFITKGCCIFIHLRKRGKEKGGGGGEREISMRRERPPPGDQACNPGMRPDSVHANRNITSRKSPWRWAVCSPGCLPLPCGLA